MTAEATKAAEAGAASKRKSPVRVAAHRRHPTDGRSTRSAGPDEDTIFYGDIDLVQARTAPIWNDLHRDRRQREGAAREREPAPRLQVRARWPCYATE
jgi:hypothetical protein